MGFDTAGKSFKDFPYAKKWEFVLNGIHVPILICCHPPQSSASTRNLTESRNGLSSTLGQTEESTVGKGDPLQQGNCAIGCGFKYSVVLQQFERLRDDDDDDEVNNQENAPSTPPNPVSCSFKGLK